MKNKNECVNNYTYKFRSRAASQDLTWAKACNDRDRVAGKNKYKRKLLAFPPSNRKTTSPFHFSFFLTSLGLRPSTFVRRLSLPLSSGPHFDYQLSPKDLKQIHGALQAGASNRRRIGVSLLRLPTKLLCAFLDGQQRIRTHEQADFAAGQTERKPRVSCRHAGSGQGFGGQRRADEAGGGHHGCDH